MTPPRQARLPQAQAGKVALGDDSDMPRWALSP
jgi:hypothetical protein